MDHRLDLGSVIAKRELRYRDSDHGDQIVHVLLGAPVESMGGTEWYCPWRIVGLGDERVRAAYGVDAFQCLQLVMKMIGATLYHRDDEGVRLSWRDNRPGDYGFPWE